MVLALPILQKITFTWIDLLDILLVAYFVYQMLSWFKGTRTFQLLRGLILLFVLFIISELFQLTTIVWLLQKFATIIVISVIIVFQPELRKALEHLGRGKLLTRFFLPEQEEGKGILHQLLRAIDELAHTKTGAIMAIERNTGLSEFMESGVGIDAHVDSELILAIFQKKSPLHDGAMIIQGNRIAAVSCLLPLSETNLSDKRLGTRHQAALGLSELTDALIIVVSEQTGTISVAENGHLERFLTRELLEEKLLKLYQAALQEELNAALVKKVARKKLAKRKQK